MKLEKEISKKLNNKGYFHVSCSNYCYLFVNKELNSCIIIDEISAVINTNYFHYTNYQNKTMNDYSSVFRFINTDNYKELLNEISFFLSDNSNGDNHSDNHSIKKFGKNRTIQSIDPTDIESSFEDSFISAFGNSYRSKIFREFPYIDHNGVRRYIDYAILGKEKYAIELNGEYYHHVSYIGIKKYKSQLFKQNSMVRDGFKVFRFSEYSLVDKEYFISELKEFIKNPETFISNTEIKCNRDGQIITLNLHTHQVDTLKQLEHARNNGNNTFLIVLPTGTGKTEIFIKDIENLKAINNSLKVLILVPTINLLEQTVQRIKARLPKYDKVIGSEFNNSNEIIVSTYASIQRKYHTINQFYFDYVVVDEAHHAVAQGIRNALEYFIPKHLIGLTATPDRFDKKQLEEIFGEYKPIMDLKSAIDNGLVVPIRCYRVKSNIDMSNIRFNGRDYTNRDLQKAILVPSRNELIVSILKKYFSGNLKNKQGIIFCVDIKHAETMSRLLNKNDISAFHVSGRDKKSAEKALSEYKNGKIRFICACDLITEGFDAPQTEILVMARPTFSQVLYTQQLGRGLRLHKGKSALYLIDVVDNYSAKLRALSVHSILGIESYAPFVSVTDNIEQIKQEIKSDIPVLEGFYEEERSVEFIDIFNFEKLYEKHLNEEQLARELFISTDTLKSWIKKKEIEPDIRNLFGDKEIVLFAPESIKLIREMKGLKEHNTASRKDDFFSFLAEKDYTFSYKIVFLLAFLKIKNERGVANIKDLVELYSSFYAKIFYSYGKNEKKNSTYNNLEFLSKQSEMQKNILKNPFEKFERKRFFYHCKDLMYLGMDRYLHSKLSSDDYTDITKNMLDDLKEYFLTHLKITLAESDYSILLNENGQVANYNNIDQNMNHYNGTQSIFTEFPSEEEMFKSYLPFYPLSIAAGAFIDSQTQLYPELWINTAAFLIRNIDNDMFISRIIGNSMEPLIKDSSYCLFTRKTSAISNGDIVLAQKFGLHDKDTSASFTLKKYEKIEAINKNNGVVEEKIILKPINKFYSNIEITKDEFENFSIIAKYIETLPIQKNDRLQ